GGGRKKENSHRHLAEWLRPGLGVKVEFENRERQKILAKAECGEEGAGERLEVDTGSAGKKHPKPQSHPGEPDTARGKVEAQGPLPVKIHASGDGMANGQERENEDQCGIEAESQMLRTITR